MAAAATTPPESSILAVPHAIRSLFKLFPLHTYDAEPLPARAPSRIRARARLYVFASEHDAQQGNPSFNPTCLKWQTYLRIANLKVDLVPSTNHASPSGSLPYLLPSSSDSRPDIPLTGAKISQYAQKHSSARDSFSPRTEAYQAVISQAIRPAWVRIASTPRHVPATNKRQLHALYLSTPHTRLLGRLYLPSSPLLSAPLLQTLRAAATAEILKTTRRPLLLPAQLYGDAGTAFEALDTLLGADEWFFGASEPGLFDADVFAYTYLILDPAFGWEDDSLRECLASCERLISHRERLYARCWQ